MNQSIYEIDNKSINFFEIITVSDSFSQNCITINRFENYSKFSSFDSDAIDVRLYIIDYFQESKLHIPNIIIYKKKIILNHNFQFGVQVNINMLFSNHFRNDHDEAKIDSFFDKELYSILMQKIDNEEYVRTFLLSLRHGLFSPTRLNTQIANDNITNDEKKIIEHSISSIAYYNNLENIKKKIEELRPDQIVSIIKVIIKNKVYHPTSSNVFNLQKNEPIQQEALNIKKKK